MSLEGLNLSLRMGTLLHGSENSSNVIPWLRPRNPAYNIIKRF
ncbi:hypothetical protein [Rickettsia endosymbiont of Orchestes rusci]